jgi:cytochrome c
VASLALTRVHPFGDAGLYEAKAAEKPIMERSPVPPEVRAILVPKCADCHSTQTRAPFYGHFAPVSWLMERDIVEARKSMNLSQWEAYSPDQQQTFAAKIAHETKAHEMPPLQYRMVHWNARVEDAEIRALSNWAHVSSSDSNQQAGDGDPVRGKGLFEKRCTGCHSLMQNRQGPRLQGVFGRAVGSVANYAYSQTLKNSKIAWDEKSLDKWLADPDAFLPGNTMDFLVSKPKERQDLIRYLKQISGK